MPAMRNIAFILALWLAFCGGGFCAEEPPAKEAAADAERIKALVNQLGAENYAKREAAAQELRVIGEAAWPFVAPLLNDADPDFQVRATALAKDIATTFQPEDEAKARKYTAMLESQNAAERAAGLDSLTSLEHAGVYWLRGHVSGKGAKPALSLKLYIKALASGEKLTGSASLSNKSNAAIWLAWKDNLMRFDEGYPDAFGDYRFSFHGRGFGRCIRCPTVSKHGYQNPIRAWHALTSSSPPESLLINQPLTAIGIYHVRVLAKLPGPKAITPRLHPPKVSATDETPGRMDGQDETTFELVMNAALAKAEDRELQSEAQTVYVLPPLPAKNEDNRLRLTAAREASDDEKVCVVKATLTSVLKDDTQVLEFKLPCYAWYAVLNADGVPVKWGSWNSALAGGPLEKFEARALPPGQSTDWTLAVPLPVEAGEYSILFGYEHQEVGRIFEIVDGAQIEPEAEARKKADPENKFKPYENGQLFAQLFGIKVTRP
jgi:hypothetical protein